MNNAADYLFKGEMMQDMQKSEKLGVDIRAIDCERKCFSESPWSRHGRKVPNVARFYGSDRLRKVERRMEQFSSL